jgi:hypothetical protein
MLQADFVKSTCKPGTTECCRYIVVGGSGFECVKGDPGMKAQLDDRVLKGTIRAVGDNCEGESMMKVDHPDGEKLEG